MLIIFQVDRQVSQSSIAEERLAKSGKAFIFSGAFSNNFFSASIASIVCPFFLSALAKNIGISALSGSKVREFLKCNIACLLFPVRNITLPFIKLNSISSGFSFNALDSIAIVVSHSSNSIFALIMFSFASLLPAFELLIISINSILLSSFFNLVTERAANIRFELVPGESSCNLTE